MNILSVLAVAGGAGVGGSLRYLISNWFNYVPGKFPIATFFINVIGSAILGCLVAYGIRHQTTELTKLFWTSGICGGFTTFSTFSLESVQLIQSGHSGWALSYMLGSVVSGIFTCWLGLKYF